MPLMILEKCKDELGSAVVPSELQNAWTYYNSELLGVTRLDGNISPLGKSNFGRDLPERFATPSYLVTKTHNYAKDNKREVERWVQDVRELCAIYEVSKYDLFFWEHRVGNWAANSLLNSDLMTETLIPFNCRQLIELWLRVPRRERMNGAIHKKIIELNWPELLEYPFNPDERFKFLNTNRLLYYFGMRLKYILGKFRH